MSEQFTTMFRDEHRLVRDALLELSDAFTAREYWTIETILASRTGETFAAELVRIDGEALAIADDSAAMEHVEALRTLILTRARVTDLGVKKLKAALPRLRIVR